MIVEGLFYLTTAIFGFFAAAYLAFSVKKTRTGGLHKVLILYLLSIVFTSLHVFYEAIALGCTTSGCNLGSALFGILAEVGFAIFFYASYKLYFYIKTFDFS